MKKRIFKLTLLILLLFALIKPVYSDSFEVGSHLEKIPSKLDDYFQSYKIEQLDNIYNRIYGKSLPIDATIDLKNLRYLKVLYYNYNKKITIGEIIVHANLAEDVLKIFKKLFLEQVEIYSMRLIDDYWQDNSETTDEISMEKNNTSAFHYRKITNGEKLSNHALGMAIDINPLENPYVKGKNVEPITTSEEYILEEQRKNSNNPHVIKEGDIIYQTFKEYGFSWGGEWQGLKDYQHFEKIVPEDYLENKTVDNQINKEEQKEKNKIDRSKIKEGFYLVLIFLIILTFLIKKKEKN